MGKGGDISRRDTRVPCSTYRLQFNSRFRLKDALGLVPYLAELGITDLYASPLFAACAGSEHGYDVCDFTRLSPCLGTEDEFAALSAALSERGMGLLLDMVPNHMGISDPGNKWWMDVLQNGPASAFANFFDIDWHSPVPGLDGKVLLPILGDGFGRVLEEGKIKLEWRDDTLRIVYYENVLPLSDAGIASILKSLKEESRSGTMTSSIDEVLASAAPKVARDFLRQQRERDPEFKAASDRVINRLNGKPGEPGSFDRLEQLLATQFYRLSWWRTAAHALNYRRFFDVTGLAGLRVEDPAVFAGSHALLLKWLAEGKVTGVRVDHPDGLRDPKAYFARLQGEFEQGRQQTAPGQNCSLYIVAEKILSTGEELPADWQVHGTTGYDFLAQLNALFVNSAHAQEFSTIYREFTGEPLDIKDVTTSRKRLILESSLAAETNALARQLASLAAANRGARDFSMDEWKQAIIELIAALPVYRTYASREPGRLSDQDEQFLRDAISLAKSRSPLDPAAFDFIAGLFHPRQHTHQSAGEAAAFEFASRFQQLSGPATAKGIEDTAFYIYNRLLSLNEVGGDPAQFGSTPEEFHQRNLARLRHWPNSMLATSTHDTKRGEDARARLNVLSELPAEWREAITRWKQLNAAKKTEVQGISAPDANDEYLLYQALIGAWPEDSTAEAGELRERIKAYVLKAARESKRHTAWTNRNEDYEKALAHFVDALLNEEITNTFLDDFRRFQKRVAFFGRVNSLSQTVLKMASPGVPDVYQGSELWNFSLVDPDNRQPVNFDENQAALRKIMGALRDRQALLRTLSEHGYGGSAKLFVTHISLACRRANERLFREGDYVPLNIAGPRSGNVIAFSRSFGDQTVIVAAPRLVAGLTRGVETAPLGQATWLDTQILLPGSGRMTLNNVFTAESVCAEPRREGNTVALANVFRSFPVALLELRRP